MRVHKKDLYCTEVFPNLLISTDYLSNPSWPNHLIYCTYKLWLSTLQKEKQVTCLCILFTHFLIVILHMMFARSWRKIWVILLISIPKIMFFDIFWRVNVLYFVGIERQPEKTWRHRESTAPEVFVRNHGNGGINNMDARKPETTIVMATAVWRNKQQHCR